MKYKSEYYSKRFIEIDGNSVKVFEDGELVTELDLKATLDLAIEKLQLTIA